MSRRPAWDRLIRFLSLFIPARFREEVYGDLVEEARARMRDGWSRRRARTWMLVQLLRSVPLLNLNAIERAMDRLDRPIRGGGAIVFGIVNGMVIFGLGQLAPQPLGTLLLTGLVAVALFAVGVVTLRRTNFVFMGTGMLLGAVEMVALALLVGVGAVSAPPTDVWLLVPAAASLLVWLALMGLEKRRSPEEYAAWKRVTDRATFVDILLLRHIPDLR